jgi:hypothetical protein
MENRLSILPIDFDLLMDLLTGRTVIDSGVPSDVKLVSVQRITVFRMVELTISSESFTPLNPGDEIPRLRPLLRRV